MSRCAAYAQASNFKKALSDCDKAIDLNANLIEAYINRGHIYDDLGNYHQAIEDYTKAINLKPNYAIAYYGRGISYANLKDVQRAIYDFEQYLKLLPNTSNKREIISKIESLRSDLIRKNSGSKN